MTDLDWGDFEPKTPRDAVGIALLTCGLMGEADAQGNVPLDWWLTDALIDALAHHGYHVEKMPDPPTGISVEVHVDQDAAWRDLPENRPALRVVRP